jgi:hypothetical protein
MQPLLHDDDASTPEEREAALERMAALVRRFYFEAMPIGCHPFLEFDGLLSKYVTLARAAHDAGIDFMNASAHNGRSLPASEHDLAYVGEKLRCIFGPALAAPSLRRAFLEALLAEPASASERDQSPARLQESPLAPGEIDRSL